jgi:hypothetical protein
MKDELEEHVLATARRSLHAVGELVIAGPQHRSHGTIRLRPSAGGFVGVASGVAVGDGDVVWDGARLAIDGRSCSEIAAAIGVEAGAPTGLYHDGCGVDVDETLALDPAAAEVLVDWLADGDVALSAFASVDPVLWPEHFDLGITLDEVNYGVSLGDAFHATPYAYVGPWRKREGPFWNAPFGAFRAARDLPGIDAISAFFVEGREQGH